MNKIILVVLVLIGFSTLSSSRKSRNKNYGDNTLNNGYGGNNKYRLNTGNGKPSYKSNFNKASSLLKNNKKTIRNALIGVAAYKALKSSRKIFSFPDDDYFMYIPAYSLSPGFNINGNKPYTQFIMPLNGMYLNCLVVPENHVLFSSYTGSEIRRNRECSKIFKSHVMMQSTFYPPSHFQYNAEINNPEYTDTTLCCVPASTIPTSTTSPTSASNVPMNVSNVRNVPASARNVTLLLSLLPGIYNSNFGISNSDNSNADILNSDNSNFVLFYYLILFYYI